MLEINFSLFVQIVNFLLLLFLLNIFLFRPIRKILAKRRERMDGFQESIETLRAKAGESEKGLEEGMLEARRKGHSEREAFKNKGRAEERGILQEASGSVEEKISAARKEMDKKMAEVRRNLEEQTAAFSKELAEKILGRSVS
jgi:F-type H+-transporting ATPase subunit b